MSRGGKQVLGAEFNHFRRQEGKIILVATVRRGPQSDVGRHVHIVLEGLDAKYVLEALQQIRGPEVPN